MQKRCLLRRKMPAVQSCRKEDFLDEVEMGEVTRSDAPTVCPRGDELVLGHGPIMWRAETAEQGRSTHFLASTQPRAEGTFGWDRAQRHTAKGL
jgi:hypothetical protein